MILGSAHPVDSLTTLYSARLLGSLLGLPITFLTAYLADDELFGSSCQLTGDAPVSSLHISLMTWTC